MQAPCLALVQIWEQNVHGGQTSGDARIGHGHLLQLGRREESG